MQMMGIRRNKLYLACSREDLIHVEGFPWQSYVQSGNSSFNIFKPNLIDLRVIWLWVEHNELTVRCAKFKSTGCSDKKAVSLKMIQPLLYFNRLSHELILILRFYGFLWMCCVVVCQQYASIKVLCTAWEAHTTEKLNHHFMEGEAHFIASP